MSRYDRPFLHQPSPPSPSWLRFVCPTCKRKISARPVASVGRRVRQFVEHDNAAIDGARCAFSGKEITIS